MQFDKITRTEEMTEIYVSLQKNFSRDEFRDYADTLAVMKDDRYAMYRIIDDGKDVGFISVWQLQEVTFVEHFVIYDDYRGKGVGGRAIDCICKKFGKVILEAEKPEDDIQKRRVAFYERHGFIANPQPYMQPAYRGDSEWVPMYLMSYPDLLDDFDATVKELYGAVYRL